MQRAAAGVDDVQCREQVPEAGAVDGINIAQIQNDVLGMAEKSLHRARQGRRFVKHRDDHVGHSSVVPFHPLQGPF